jgi:hypothetical protein
MVSGSRFVVFFSDRPLHITTGFLILNLLSFAGEADRANVNAVTLLTTIVIGTLWLPFRAWRQPLIRHRSSDDRNRRTGDT